jgi:serine/threonine-protein kinase
VRPASHAGAPKGPASTVPYGARLRLNRDFALDNYNPAARVILNTLKRYGMVLADGGNIALTAESDYFTTTKWTDLGIDSKVFAGGRGNRAIRVSDFEVLNTGPRIAETYDCKPAVPPVGLTLRD